MSIYGRMAQQQKLSPQMIQQANLLQLSADDLRAEIFAEIEKNPALEITGDSSYLSAKDSDDHQKFLESTPDSGPTLQEHLLEQWAVTPLDDFPLRGRILGEQLIQNLDEHGFFIEPCSNFLKEDDSPGLLDHVLEKLHSLDPSGVCCEGIAESLAIQAENREDCPAFVPDLLKNHFLLLDPPRPPLILRKLHALPPEKKAACTDYSALTESDIENALDFIRTLNPHPAQDFPSGNSTVFANPDVIVRQASEEELEDGSDDFVVELTSGQLPKIAVSKDFRELAETEGAGARYASEAVRNARDFLSAVEQRTRTLFLVSNAIVFHQKEFFRKGRAALVPLKMAEIAEETGLHEATVSRAVNGKFLRCTFGVFELRSFFTGSGGVKTAKPVAAATSADESETLPVSEGSVLSKEAVQAQIRQILSEHEASGSTKKLSDEKIAAALKNRGIDISRRTVAKYRSQLNIKSSFDR